MSTGRRRCRSSRRRASSAACWVTPSTRWWSATSAAKPSRCTASTRCPTCRPSASTNAAPCCDSLDSYRHGLERDRALLDTDANYRHAYELLSAPQTRLAFDLDREPAVVRDRYGRHRAGQACLLGRRLVEAGVPLVTVIWNHNNRGQDVTPEDPDSYGWDTHNDIFEVLKGSLLPRFDESFSALLLDLEQRGLLETTLVVCMGEFGRAPHVALERNFAGSTPGRKHWAAVYSLVLAGAGVARGAVYGASDKFGAYPKSNACSPGDIAATMFAALGIDPEGHYTDSLDRPYPIATGKPLAGVYR